MLFSFAEFSSLATFAMSCLCHFLSQHVLLTGDYVDDGGIVGNDDNDYWFLV